MATNIDYGKEGQVVLEILAYLPERIRRAILGQAPPVLDGVEEVRLREGRPLALVLSGGDCFISLQGTGQDDSGRGSGGQNGGGQDGAGQDRSRVVTRADLDRCVALISRNSVYAFEEEMRQGFLTLPGGHRVGLSGKVVLDGGHPRTIHPVTGLNFRVSRALTGAADPVLPALLDRRAVRLRHTLVISPPGAGKTTLLRDLARAASEGRPEMGLPGQKVTIVDERSELAGCFQGCAQLDVGPRTDVLDGCPKAEGIMLALRALSPQVIVTDEIGRPEDAQAVEEAANAGVTVLASAHGADLSELAKRPTMAALMGRGVFERVITLARQGRPGVVRGITDAAGERSLCG